MIKTGCSYSVKHSIVYEWKINEITSFLNAAKHSEDVEEMNSPKFSTGAKIKDSWNLQLRVAKDSDSSNKKSWMSLYVKSNIDTKIRASFAFSMVNNKKERAYIDIDTNLVIGIDLKAVQSSRFFNHLGKYWGFKNVITIDKLLEKKQEFLPNDVLTVCVDLTVYDDYLEIKNQIAPLRGCKRKLRDDFIDLLTAKKNSDVVILAGDKKFYVHKIFLTSRSCVFEAMFSHDMKEKKENEVTITDIDGEVFEKLLEYIYTDRVNNLDIFAEGLLDASDKYQLQGLKEMCENFLAKTISIENAIRILILADRHSAKRLKEKLLNYVVSNFVKFKNTEDFKALKESQSSLFSAIIEKYANEH